VQRNYRTFLLFIYSTTLYIMWTFGVSLGMLFVKQRELAAANPQLDTGRVWLNTLGELRGLRVCASTSTAAGVLCMSACWCALGAGNHCSIPAAAAAAADPTSVPLLLLLLLLLPVDAVLTHRPGTCCHRPHRVHLHLLLVCGWPVGLPHLPGGHQPDHL
jgi:hypothetical protein